MSSLPESFGCLNCGQKNHDTSTCEKTYEVCWTCLEKGKLTSACNRHTRKRTMKLCQGLGDEAIEQTASSLMSAASQLEPLPQQSQKLMISDKKIVTMWVTVNRAEIRAVINTSSTCNVISYDLAMKLQLPIIVSPSGNCINYGTGQRTLLSRVVDTFITVNDRVVQVQLWIMDNFAGTMVLGTHFLEDIQATLTIAGETCHMGFY